MNTNLIKNILRIGAVAGVIGTAYFSAKDGEKICRAWKQVNGESFGMTAKRKLGHYIRNTPRLLRPAWRSTVCGAGSITCMAFSERISYKQIAALTGTCVYLAKNRDFFEGKLKEVVGEEKLDALKKEFITKEAPKMANFPTVEETGFGDLLCYEGYSGRWFRSDEEHCLEAQEMLQKQYDEDIYCCLNDYYGYLGITMTQFGHELGWVNSKDWYGPEIKFTNTLLSAEEWDDKGPDGLEVNEPVYVMEIETMPMYSWQEI